MEKARPGRLSGVSQDSALQSKRGCVRGTFALPAEARPFLGWPGEPFPDFSHRPTFPGAVIPNKGIGVARAEINP